MPTTLPVRFRDSDFGRQRGQSRATAALLLWAATMLAVTAASPASHAAIADTVTMVMP